MDIRHVFWTTALLFAATAQVSSASTPEPSLIVRADRLPAPSGYVAYELHLWGMRASGRFASIRIERDGGLIFEHGSGDDGAVEDTHADHIDRSVVFLPQGFAPSAELLAKHPQRLPDVALPKDQQALVLRLLGFDPNNSSIRLYEATFNGVVFSGTISAFELNESVIKAGYPYRGPYGLQGSLTARRADFAGQKSTLRVPMNVDVPSILIEQPSRLP